MKREGEWRQILEVQRGGRAREGKKEQRTEKVSKGPKDKNKWSIKELTENIMVEKFSKLGTKHHFKNLNKVSMLRTG